MRAVARGMRTFLVAPVVLAATVVTAAAQPDTTLPPLRVIAPSRLPGDPLPAGSVPAAIDVIPGDALRGTGTTTLPRALEHLPGVAVGDEQGNTHQLSLGLRGFQVSPVTGVPQGVSVFVDGVRVNEPTVEEVNFDLLPLDEVERIEVIRGPSALFGRNTLGGAINIITRRGGTARELVPEMEAGSFGYQKYRLRFGGVEGPIDYYVGGSFSREDGWRERSASHLGKMFAKVGLQQGGTDLSLSYQRADNRIEQPGSLPESVLRQDRRANFTGGDFYKPLFNQATVALRQELGERFELAITAFGRALSVEQFNANVLDDNQRAFFDTTSLGATAQLTHQAEILERRNRLVLGFDHAHSDITVKVFEEQALRVRIDSRVHDHSDAFGFFAEDTLDLLRGIVGDADTLVLTAGARYDSIRHDIRDDLVRPGRRPSASQDSVFERGNPHVGLNYNATPALGFFAAYGESFRAPAFLELTCATPAAICPGLQAGVAPDPPIQAVKARSYEAGVRAQPLPWLATELSVFRTDVSDDIFSVSPKGTVGVFFQNVGATRREGVEASARASVSRRVSAFVNYAYTEATFQDDVTLATPRTTASCSGGLCTQAVRQGSELPLVPRHRLNAGVEYFLTPWLSASLSMRYVGTQRLRGDEENVERPLPDYVVFGAGLKTEWKGFSAFLALDNLLDARYETFGTFGINPKAAGAPVERFLTPAPPIHVTGGVSYRF
jgi:outer membrane receptor protein involved in Fe transport